MNPILSILAPGAAAGGPEGVFLTVLNMSATGAIVICAVLLLRLLLKRAPKQYSYWLWAAAAFRLVCPVSWKSVFSIFSLAPARGATVPTVDVSAAAPVTGSAVSAIEYVPPAIGYAQTPRVELIVPQVSDAVSEALPAADPLSSVNPMQVWLALGSVLWLLGILALLVWGVVSYARLARRLRTAVRLEDGVWQSEAVGSPFLLGFLRPRIFVPYGLEGERLDYVLAHERFHIRRRDYLVKLLAFLILAVHWFNPLVWLAFVLMGRDMEMRCDEAVLGRAEAQKKPYSETLLSFAVGGRFPSPGPLAFGESGVKARIKNALRWRRPSVWVTVIAALLVAVGVAACVANPADAADDAHLKSDAWGLARAAAQSAGVTVEQRLCELERSEDGTGATVSFYITGEVYRSRDAEGAERTEILTLQADGAEDIPQMTVSYALEDGKPVSASVELTGPTPWVWAHTVQTAGLTGEVRKFAQNELRYDLTEAQLAGLCERLRAVRRDSVVPGRGFPAQNTVTLTDAEGRRFTLGFGGDCAVLSFDDETAKRWPIPADSPAPSWEIRDEALLACLEGLEEEKETVLTAVLEGIPISTRDDYLFLTVREPGSGARYALPLVNAEPSPEPQLGDTLEITYTGELPEDGGEFDPAQIVRIAVAARPRFSDELRSLIIEDWKTHSDLSATLAGSVYRYFVTWDQAAAFAGMAPENPLEGETWLEKQNTAGTDVVLPWNDGLQHASVHANGDETGSVRGLSLEAGYRFTGGDVRVVLGVSLGGLPPEADGAAAQTLALREGLSAERRDAESGDWLSRTLRFTDGGWGWRIQLISNSKDLAALDDAWERLLAVWAAPAGPLTADTLLQLAELRGSALAWSDFAGYPHEDIGSGLYIWEFPVEGGWYVYIGGDPASEPMYVTLSRGRMSEGAPSLDLRGSSPEALRAFLDTTSAPAPLMAVTSGGETVSPWQLMRFTMTWDDAHGTWITADGIPVERAKDAPGVPTLTMAEDFSVRYAPGASRRYPLRIYDADFQLLSDHNSVDAAQLWFLEPGDYYLVFDTFAPVGRYIPAEDKYEQTAYDCVLRLRVERQLARPWTPGAVSFAGATPLLSARLGSLTLTDENSRRELCALLTRAEETYPSECAGSVILFLTDARGVVWGLCPALDGCGNFWSGGTYYRYSDENELWTLMNDVSRAGLFPLCFGDDCMLALFRDDPPHQGTILESSSFVIGSTDPWHTANAVYYYTNLNALSWTDCPARSLTPGKVRDSVRLQTEDRVLWAFDSLDQVLWLDGHNGTLRWVLPEQRNAELAEHAVYDLLRSWFDEAEFAALSGDGVVIPDRGQTPEEAAAEWCQATAETHLAVSEGSSFRYTFVKTFVTMEGEAEDARRRALGDIGANAYSFRLAAVFTLEPEADQRALARAYAGNGGAYEGSDPEVPAGAIQSTVFGYVALEADGWHGRIMGTGW